jgi:hypothetical protein
MVVGPTVIVGQLMTIVTLLLPVHPMESVAVMVIRKLPIWVGVPDKMCEVLLKFIPVGSVPLRLKVVVPTPPLCEKVVLV